MKVLSLFNGMSFGRMALESLNIPVEKYYSSEIDKYAIQAAQALYPSTIQLGDVTKWREWDIDWSSIDLVTGGFPCQAWSMAGKQLGDKDERGMLFWTMLDIIKHVKYHNQKADFLIENVKMKKEFEEYITTHTENALGKVHKILINSSLVSAQNRNRYYWTSFAVEQPEDKGILLKDIIEHGDITGHTLSDKAMARIARKKYSDPQVMPSKTGTINTKNNSGQLSIDKGTTLIPVRCGAMRDRYIVDGKRADSKVDSMAGKTEQRLEIRKDEKTNTLTTVQKDNLVVIKSAAERGRGFEVRKDSKANCLLSDGHQSRWLANGGAKYRKLTPRECFRLQTVPERHIDTLLNAGISNTQLYKMCGNGWTMEVIAHILKNIKD